MVAITTIFCSIIPLVYVIVPLFYVIKSNSIGHIHEALAFFFWLMYRNIMRFTIHYTIEITLSSRVTTAVVSHSVKHSHNKQMSCLKSNPAASTLFLKIVKIGSAYSFDKLSHLFWCCLPNKQFFSYLAVTTIMVTGLQI
jgi:hypothetical protein